MSTSDGFWRKLFRITLPTLFFVFLFLEFIVFRFLLPASDWPYRYSIQNSEDAVRYLYKDAPIYATGVHRLGFPEVYAGRYTINREGWNSTKEYQIAKGSKKRIAVIGDSFVDALQVDVDKCFAEVLERNLAPRVEVYRFGFGAAPLTQYLQVLRYVKRKFHPDIVVISVQANDFLASLYGYGNENGDFLQVRQVGKKWIETKPVPYKPSTVRLALKRSAIFRYFYGNLRFRSRVSILGSLFKPNEEKDYQMNIDIRKNLTYLDKYQSLCRYVFTEMKQAAGSGTKLLLIMDTNRQAIYKGTDPRAEASYRLVQVVSRVATELSIPFVDLTDAFETDYKKYGQNFDFRIDGHWNAHGHRIVANAITAFLKKAKWYG